MWLQVVFVRIPVNVKNVYVLSVCVCVFFVNLQEIVWVQCCVSPVVAVIKITVCSTGFISERSRVVY